LEWLSNEGSIRDKIHNSKLYETGVTRIQEGQNFYLCDRKTEFKVESMQYLNVENGNLDVLMCIFENK
jgi:hypothetical protein